MRSLRWLILALAPLSLAASKPAPSGSMAPSLSSLVSAPVTVFGAKWCGACRALESGLAARKIAYAVVDVDESPAAFARARNESGSGGAIPLTSVETSQKKVWIVGADVDAVERAQRE